MKYFKFEKKTFIEILTSFKCTLSRNINVPRLSNNEILDGIETSSFWLKLRRVTAGNNKDERNIDISISGKGLDIA